MNIQLPGPNFMLAFCVCAAVAITMDRAYSTDEKAVLGAPASANHAFEAGQQLKSDVVKQEIPLGVNRWRLGDFPEYVSEYGKDFENAFLQSEFIGVFEYCGFENKDNIGYNNPPSANFRLVKRLKGPPMGRDYPIKFDFSDTPAKKPPKDWMFGPDKMPPLKSQWIIFIPQFVLVPGQGFATYKGAYGRQEANEKNLAEINSIIHRASENYKNDSDSDLGDVEWVGTTGENLFHQEKYSQAYLYLNKATHMSGGEKYRGCFEACKEKLNKQWKEYLKKRQDLAAPSGAAGRNEAEDVKGN